MRTQLLVAGIVLALPLLAAAAEDGHGHGPDWGVLAIHVLNAGVLVFLIYRFARAPILDFLVQRSRRIRREIESAEERLRVAEAEIVALRERLAHFDREAQHMLEATVDQAELERTRTVERAHQTSARIQQDAERVADRAIERARQELRAEAADLATKLAGEILGENMTPEDDERLVREFIDRIGEQQ